MRETEFPSVYKDARFCNDEYMFVITVLPIARGIGKEELSYLSPESLQQGDLLFVPVRKKKVPAIVVESRESTALKAELKEARFRLKILRAPVGVAFYDQQFIEAARILGRVFVGSTGQILKLLTPAPVLRGARTITVPQQEDKRSYTRVALPSALQAPREERSLLYRNTVRETFARGQSVFVCVQTFADTERLASTLSRGLLSHVFILHSSLSPKEQLLKWQAALTHAHPVLIIGTAHFLSLPRNDFGTYILEGTELRSYKSRERPYLDYSVVVRILAETMGAEFVLGDTMLSVETHHAIERGELMMHPGSRQRITLDPAPEIIAVRNSATSQHPSSDPARFIFSTQLHDMLSANGRDGKRSFLFAHRRGVAPITICADCGTLVQCRDCTAPLLLQLSGKAADQKSGRTFFCARCNKKSDAAIICSRCESWRLVPLGIGAERVFEAVRTLFPRRPAFLLTSDTVRSTHEVITVRESFLAKPDSIIIGTEMALHALPEPIPLVAAVTLDALFAIPDYRMRERMYALVVQLAEAASEHCLIQTRRPNEKLWNELREIRRGAFYKKELLERQAFAYPPVTTLIKIRWSGTREKRALAEKHINEMFKSYEPTLVDGDDDLGQKKLIALLRIPRDAWPLGPKLPVKTVGGKDYSSLSALLRSLPRDFVVDVHPQNLLA